MAAVEALNPFDPFSHSKPKIEGEEERWRADLSVRLICQECKQDPPNLIEEYSSGDVVCGDCGVVLSDKIVDTRSEWRTFANEEGDDPSRVGGPSNPFLDGADNLSTIISYRDGNTGMSRDLQRAQARHSVKSGERNLVAAYREIQNMCDTIQLLKQEADTAKMVYRQVDERKLCRGKPSDAVQAACIFLACRKGGVPRTFKEICALTKVKKKLIGQCYKIIEASLKVIQNTDSQGHSAEDLVARFCSHLGDSSVEMYARAVVLRSKEHGILAGRSPISVAASSIYFGSHLVGRPQKAADIARVAGVSDVTIRTSYRLLFQHKEDLVEPRWFEEGRRFTANYELLPSP